MGKVDVSRCEVTGSEVTPEMIVQQDDGGRWHATVLTELQVLLPDGRRVYFQGRGTLLGNII